MNWARAPILRKGRPYGFGDGTIQKSILVSSCYKSSIHIIPPTALICPNFRLQFSVGVALANPQFWGREGHRGSGMGLFKRALVSFYRLSIVTFPLSLRVSEILPLLFSSMPLFPTPPLVSTKFPHVPLGVGGSPFGYKERRCLANCWCN